MSRKSKIVSLAIGAMLLLPSAAPDVWAQSGPRGRGDGAGWGPGMMMGPGMMGGGNFGFMCNPRSAGMAEWRIERIEAAVKPNDNQKKTLEALKAASTKAAETLATACAAEVPTKSTERLALMEKRAEAGMQAIKLVRPAFDTFYASLDEEQRTKLDAIGPRRWGWRNWRWR